MWGAVGQRSWPPAQKDQSSPWGFRPCPTGPGWPVGHGWGGGTPRVDWDDIVRVWTALIRARLFGDAVPEDSLYTDPPTNAWTKNRDLLNYFRRCEDGVPATSRWRSTFDAANAASDAGGRNGVQAAFKAAGMEIDTFAYTVVWPMLRKIALGYALST